MWYILLSIPIYILEFLLFIVSSIIKVIIYFRRKLWKYKNIDHDIINCVVPNKNLYIETHNGYVPITALHLKRKFKKYRMVLDDGTVLNCADTHMVCTKWGYSKYVTDIRKGEPIFTKHGKRYIKSIKPVFGEEHMFDVTIPTEDKLYYTNDILSHNSIVTAIFLVWYLLCHKDRNVMVTSENGDKVKELVEKISTIMEELPFFMKLGMRVNNVMTKAYDTDCKLVAQTTTENTGASFTIHLLYCDEFALVNHKFLNKFYRTIYPTLTSSEISRMIITSTARGMNKFYELYTDAMESKNRFNPMRTDWYEVPLMNKDGTMKRDKKGNIIYRGEKWRQEQISDLGSEEDFNQEFGNQFIAGSSLLFQSSLLKRLKRNMIDFEHREIEIFNDLDISYEDKLKWHPNFDMDNLKHEASRFVISIDLADGTGGDYTVLNIHQILPMSRREIDNLKIYSDDKDFFKLVQIGLFRSNTTELPEVARIFYHLVCDVLVHDHTKAVLEMNHEGNYFRNLSSTINGDSNIIEEDYLYVKFKYNFEDEKSEVYRIGLNNQSNTKSYGIKILKDKVRYKQLIFMETTSVNEALSFGKNKKGKFESQTRNDDVIMTEVNISHYFNTLDFVEQIDELLVYLPESFKELLAKKLNRDFIEHEEGGIEDLL